MGSDRPPQRHGRDSSKQTVAPTGPERPPVDELPFLFEQLGLSNYESRVLAAVMARGSGTATEIAAMAGVQRSNVYPVLDSLRGQNLVEYRAGKVARWVCPSRDEVIRRLSTARFSRLQQAAGQVAALGEEAMRVAATLGPEESNPPSPSCHLVASDLQLVSIYNRYLGEAEEVLVCNREPYPGRIEVFPPIMAALARGIRARALYQAHELQEREDLEEVAEVYASAGAESRVVGHLPLAMAVFDKSIVLASLADSGAADAQSPISLFVEHSGFAETCAGSFEQLWRTARPLRPGTGSSVSLSKSEGQASVMSTTK